LPHRTFRSYAYKVELLLGELFSHKWRRKCLECDSNKLAELS
jgi:hypothetical protein